MSFQQELLDIQSRFNTLFPVAQPGVRIAYENETFTPPDDDYWVRVYIMGGDANQMSFGSTLNLHRFVGIIMVQCFGPTGAGEAGVRAVGDSVAGVFRAKQFGSGITCRSPRWERVGASGAYFQGNVIAPFYRDETF